MCAYSIDSASCLEISRILARTRGWTKGYRIKNLKYGFNESNQDDEVEIRLTITRSKRKHKSAGRQARDIDRKTVFDAKKAALATLAKTQPSSVISASPPSKPQDSLRDSVERKDDKPPTSSVPSSSSFGHQRDMDIREIKRPTVGAGSLDTSMSAEANQSSRKRSTKRKPSSSPQKAARRPPALPPQSEEKTGVKSGKDFFPSARSAHVARKVVCDLLETKIKIESNLKTLPGPVEYAIKSLALFLVAAYTDPSQSPAQAIIQELKRQQSLGKIRDFRLQSMKLVPSDFPDDFFRQH